MKKNTQKILIALYSSTEPLRKRLKVETLNLVTPDLTDGGRRSLLHVLKKNGLIHSERVLGSTSISISEYGANQLEAQFPALSSKWDQWQGNWDCLVFTQAPKGDKQFRYLRSLLVEEGSVAVSRGVYIAPFAFSQRVLNECKEMYRNSVLIFSVGEWKLAPIRTLIVEKYGLLDLVETYSGISKEVTRLLISIDTNNRLTDKDKTDINLVYDRLRDALSEDLGFCQYYFGEVSRVRQLAFDLNSILARA